MVGFECLNPSTCQRPLSLGSTASTTIIPIDASNTINYAPVTLDFGPDDDSTANVVMNYSDAGAIRLHAEHAFENGTIISGTSNSFVVKPHSYLITLSDGETGSDYEADSATDSIYKKAGEPFTVTVTARSFDESTTPNFGNESSSSVTVDLNHSLARPNNEDDGFTGVPGMLNGTWSNHINNSGRFSGDYSFNEVGIIDLTASIDYLGTGIVTTTLSSIGRFTPASLSLTVINDGTFISANTDGTLNFTYVGQPFSYDPADRPSLRVTALNASSPATLTSNYSGAWGKLNADSIEFTEPTSDEIQDGTAVSTRMALAYVQDPEGFRDPTITANPPAAVNGIFDAAFANDEFTYDKDSNSQISPFTPNVNLIITKVTDDDEIISTGSITLNPTGSETIRFGRMRMDSAHGSEIEPLEMAYRLEYFDSPGWLLHDDKNSTITTGDISSNPTGISATSIKRTTPEGKFYITLSPPALENNGPYTITTNVGEGEPGSEKHWLRYDWENDGNFDDNPSGTATFGIYKGNSHQIFSRQAFQ
jgi:MSHA biogenesis protein MshQ